MPPRSRTTITPRDLVEATDLRYTGAGTEPEANEDALSAFLTTIGHPGYAEGSPFQDDALVHDLVRGHGTGRDVFKWDPAPTSGAEAKRLLEAAGVNLTKLVNSIGLTMPVWVAYTEGRAHITSDMVPVDLGGVDGIKRVVGAARAYLEATRQLPADEDERDVLGSGPNVCA